MKKKLLSRCLMGAPIGLAISTAVTILISFILGDGDYYPVVPALIEVCGTEMNAVLLQAICSLLYGAVFAGATVIWEKDDWSILRQTLTYLIVCSLATLPVAYFMHWMEHSLWGVIGYFAIFFGIYLLIWLSQYSAMKKRVQQLNAKVLENNMTNFD